MSLRRFTEMTPTNAPATDEWAIRHILMGWNAVAIATASGMSRRTAQRWISDTVGLETVTIDGWTATYVIRRGKRPVRISSWERT